MDGDIGAMLQSVLSDPEQMSKLTRMAQGLMGAGQESSGAEPQPAGTEPAPSFPGDETRLLSALGRAFSQGQRKSRATELLMAMRPYMKPEKQEKLDRAMQIARMAHIAGTVMQEYGGGFHGI